MKAFKQLAAAVVAAGIAAIALPASAYAANGDIAIDATNFPDENLRENIEQFDKNHDGTLTTAERNAVTSITDGSIGIWVNSAKGIEFFPNLQVLELGGSDLTSVNVTNNPKLKEISIQSARLTSIDVTKNPLLEELRLDNNSIGSIDISQNRQLKILSLSNDDYDEDCVEYHYTCRTVYNHLTSLDISHNPFLEELNLGNGYVGSIMDVMPPECKDGKCNALAHIDTSKNPNLRMLTLDANSLRSIDVSQNNKLTSLSLPLNHLEQITYPQTNIIEELYLGSNNLTSLDTGKQPIQWLYAENNPLVAAKISGPYASASNYVGTITGSTYSGSYRNNTFDLRAVAPWFDTSKVSNLRGATLAGTVLNIPANQQQVAITYDYDAGYGATLRAKLQLTNNGSDPVSPSSIRFSDVTDKTPHHDDIVWLADNGISTGWPMKDGTYVFRGMDTVKRQDMAAFLRRLAVKYDIAGAKDFKPTAADWKRFRDVNRSTPHAEDILWLASTGISTGWKESNGSFTFRGMDTVKRQDMAAFLYRLADKAGKAGGVSPKTDFTDVTDRTPHAAEVRWLGGSGISQGYRNPNGTWRFEGMTSVYRQDMAAFLHRLNDRLTK